MSPRTKGQPARQGAATVPDAPEPQEREYLVAGPQPVLGHRPGETFRATLAPDHEQRLLTSGALTTTNPEAPDGASDTEE